MRWAWGLGIVVVVILVFVLPSAETTLGTWWSVLPPIVAISLALIFREVLLSLFLGVWLGTTILAGGNVGAGFFRLVDTQIRGALVDPDHISILIFSMLLGGMVGVMSRAGGTRGVVQVLEPYATTPRRAQVVTWLMGVMIFFDDYSNTLIVGNSMRPVTDRHHVSREKLAFLVDSTAAPVACVALVSTWIGYQVSLVGDALTARAVDLNPFTVFLGSIPYAFYPLFALILTLTVALSRRDWGPMLRAERRAAGGELMAATAQPLADYASSGLNPDDDTPRRWINAAIPVVLVVVVTLWGLVYTGRQSLEAGGMVDPGLREIIGASDPFTVLLWASLVGLAGAIILVVAQRILSIRQSLEAMVGGFRSMLMAVVVLTLAWSLGQVCTELETAKFLVGAVGERLAPGLVPTTVFLVAAAVSFATGTSWGTMAILTPLAVPLVLSSATPELLAPTLAATVSAILGGSVFGDHCSPISDTTIMSSMASGCDHVDHVRTQLPYSLLIAVVAIVVGYLPAGLAGASPIILLPAGAVVLIVWVRFFGRPVAA